MSPTPPPQPPMLSPDHKWVWDGTQWRPVAVHQAVFPSWQSVGAGVPAEVAAPQFAPAPRAARVVTPPPMASPAPVYQVAAPEPEAPPPWIEQPRPGINNFLYVVVGAIVLVIAGILFSTFGPTSLPWQQSAAARPTAEPTVPITDYTEHGLADRLVNAVIAPRMAELNQSLTVVGETCTGPITQSCEDALTNADNRVQKLLVVLDREYVPSCVSHGVKALRADLQKMDVGAQAALKGAKDGDTSATGAGLGQLGAARNQMQADDAALKNTAKSPSCDVPRTEPTA